MMLSHGIADLATLDTALLQRCPGAEECKDCRLLVSLINSYSLQLFAHPVR